MLSSKDELQISALVEEELTRGCDEPTYCVLGLRLYDREEAKLVIGSACLSIAYFLITAYMMIFWYLDV